MPSVSTGQWGGSGCWRVKAVLILLVLGLLYLAKEALLDEAEAVPTTGGEGSRPSEGEYTTLFSKGADRLTTQGPDPEGQTTPTGTSLPSDKIRLFPNTTQTFSMVRERKRERRRRKVGPEKRPLPFPTKNISFECPTTKCNSNDCVVVFPMFLSKGLWAWNVYPETGYQRFQVSQQMAEQEELNNELQDVLKSRDDLVEQEEQEELNNELQGLDNLISKQRDKDAAAPVKTPEPIVKWKKRDVDGNQMFERPRASRNLPNQAGPSRRKAPRVDAPDCEMVFAPETVECFLQDLQLSLSDASGDELETSAPTAPLMASLDWGTRKSLFLERWKTERPRLINSTAAQENVANRICQQCGSNPAAVRCRDCRPRPFLCAECDVGMHTRHVLHNRDAMTAGFFQPLPPTTFVADKALSHCVRLMPVEMPEKICGCSTVSLRVNPGKVVAVVTINGRHDLSMPELSCHTCDATWAAGLDDLIQSGYWPATLNFSTIYETDVFHSFEEMKMAAPGLSCQAFLRMLDQRTFRFGRSGKISAGNFQQSYFEWEAVRFEVENICKEESFICPACTPDMLAVSVDGNRKHYRFKHAARSEEKATFEGVFIAKDEEVTRTISTGQPNMSLEEVFVEGSGLQPERLPKDPPAR